MLRKTQKQKKKTFDQNKIIWFISRKKDHFEFAKYRKRQTKKKKKTFYI